MQEDTACWLIVFGCAAVTTLLTFAFTETRPNSRYNNWWEQFGGWWDSGGFALFCLILVAYMFIAGMIGFLHYGGNFEGEVYGMP